MRTYEHISEFLADLSPAGEKGAYSIEWLVDNALAVGRDSEGNHVIIIVGDELVATYAAVASAMRHSRWRPMEGDVVTGNLMSLPSGTHYRAAATMIAVELVRAGIGERDAQEVFREVEPLIDIIITRVLLPPEARLGLVGELFVLELLLTETTARDDPTGCWLGWQERSRDFDLGRVGIEVKTTTLDQARHHIHSIDQVECRSLDGGALEELFLVSVGLRLSSGGAAMSIVSLTDRILGHLGPVGADGERNKNQQMFLDRLARYGPASCLGYQHDEMRELDHYGQGFDFTYPPRLYDMDDENVKILRRADLAETFVLASGLQYVVQLPEVIPGTVDNPRGDFATGLRGLRGAS